MLAISRSENMQNYSLKIKNTENGRFIRKKLRYIKIFNNCDIVLFNLLLKNSFITLY